MKALIASSLVALSLFAGIASVTSTANAAEFGSRQWWDQMPNG